MSEQSTEALFGPDPDMSDQAVLNHFAFVERHQGKLEAEHSGKMALMRDGAVVEIVEDMDVAYELGLRRFGSGNFSLERIGASPHRLGVLEYAFA
ncbi:hypothetical protein [Candidatus Poriferisodalis sp.]|uniref:hypothetical protein n=1 Tax=Candidatus Poriferisodalis sp. TaxID=3101277 RepID=UPI003B522A47